MQPGELDPEFIHTPGIYVDRVIKGKFEKRIEHDRHPATIDVPFTTAQAAGVGVRRDVLTRLVRSGLIRRVVDGVYVDAVVPIPA